MEIVLTGGATGMGLASVERLLARGHAITVLDVAQPAVDGVTWLNCDLSDPASIDATVSQLPAVVDVLVNVAGIAGPDPAAHVVAVNFLGLRHLTLALLERMPRGGRVVNVSSTAGRDWQKNEDRVRGLLDTPDFASGLAWLEANAGWDENPYKFSKQCASAWTYRGAGLGMTRGVTVNCVNPGAVETQLTPAFQKLLGADMYRWVVDQIGRHAQPDDVAEVIEWLAVGDCRWVNGVELVVDGGYIAGITDGWIDVSEAPSG